MQEISDTGFSKNLFMTLGYYTPKLDWNNPAIGLTISGIFLTTMLIGRFFAFKKQEKRDKDLRKDGIDPNTGKPTA